MRLAVLLLANNQQETKKAVRPQILLNWSVDTYDSNYIIIYSSNLKEKTVNI